MNRLLEKVSQLGRDQRQFGRRRQHAKRSAAPLATKAHAKGFVEFVEDVPARLSAVRKLRVTAELSETALAATKLAEEAASEKLRSPAHVFLSSCAAESEPSRTPLEKVAICTDAPYSNE